MILGVLGLQGHGILHEREHLIWWPGGGELISGSNRHPLHLHSSRTSRASASASDLIRLQNTTKASRKLRKALANLYDLPHALITLMPLCE